MKRGTRSAVLIAGPTASGKSARAVAMARQRGAMIVNADALQVYAGLSIVTARPQEADTGGVPHLLYGTVPPETRFSTGDWARTVARLIEETAPHDLVFVGGTGLYFETLTVGFAEVPEISQEAVDAATAMIKGLDAAGRGALVARVDPLIAARLSAPDPQRVVRALAVKLATGESLASFQDAAQRALLADWHIERLVVDPGREILRERIDRRFRAMVDAGAVDEVAAFLERGLDPALPAMKAIGVAELGAYLRGETDLDRAIELAVIASRQYAKRQRTWIRGRMADWPRA